MGGRLEQRDYYKVIDTSGSMEETDTPTGQSRFAYAEESTIAIARKIEKLDPDGFDLIPFAARFKCYNNVTAEKVKDIFKEHQPFGGTVLAPVLKYVFDDYLAKKKAGNAKLNGALLLVVTDGQPQDEAEVAKTIVEFTKKLDRDEEFGIQFVQIGKDPGAKRFLQKLDDDLVKLGAKFDIVDTKTMDEIEEIGIVAALEAALDD